MNWTTVYDFGHEPLRIGSMLIPVSFVLIGYGLAFFNIKSNSSKERKRTYNTTFGIIFGTFALLFGAVTIPNNLSTYYETKNIYKFKKYTVIEGIVENFVPMPYSGHQDEKFTLNNVNFSYSDFNESYYGFNNTKSHGGPIDSKKNVRLSYFTKNDNNIILKIEVAKQ